MTWYVRQRLPETVVIQVYPQPYGAGEVRLTAGGAGTLLNGAYAANIPTWNAAWPLDGLLIQVLGSALTEVSEVIAVLYYTLPPSVGSLAVSPAVWRGGYDHCSAHCVVELRSRSDRRRGLSVHLPGAVLHLRAGGGRRVRSGYVPRHVGFGAGAVVCVVLPGPDQPGELDELPGLCAGGEHVGRPDAVVRLVVGGVHDQHPAGGRPGAADDHRHRRFGERPHRVDRVAVDDPSVGSRLRATLRRRRGDLGDGPQRGHRHRGRVRRCRSGITRRRTVRRSSTGRRRSSRPRRWAVSRR
jgi:hypothetical protein